MSSKRTGLGEDEFIQLYEMHGPLYIANATDTNVRSVNGRRKRLEKKHNRDILAPIRRIQQQKMSPSAKLELEVKNGCVVLGADAHFWPQDVSTAFLGMLQVIRDLKPVAVVMNGDTLDGSRISRHPPIGWETTPSVMLELQACQQRLAEIEAAAPDAKLYWPLGNHDARFETRLAAVAPEFAKVKGMHLHEHFSSRWRHCWTVWINNDVVVKHRFKGGLHAGYNNTVQSGKNIVTGHLHKGVVRAFTDYNGTRWSVDMPTLAEPHGGQFQDYTELNPLDWRSGFVVLSFHDGQLMQPEMALTTGEGEYEFRGRRRTVSIDER